jgi:hypothetical protein
MEKGQGANEFESSIGTVSTSNSQRAACKSIGMVIYGTKNLYSSERDPELALKENLTIHIQEPPRTIMDIVVEWAGSISQEVDQILVGHEHGSISGKCHYQCIVTFCKKVDLSVKPFQSPDGGLLFMYQKAKNPHALAQYCKKEGDFTYLYPEKLVSKVYTLKGSQMVVDPYATIVTNSSKLSNPEARQLIKDLAPRDYFMNYSNICKAVDDVCIPELPDFEWRWPEWSSSLPQSCRIDAIRKWYDEFCVPDQTRRQALVLFGKHALGKTRFAKSLVNDERYYVCFSNRFTVGAINKAGKSPKLVILDDMEYPAQDNVECWKQLLTGQKTAIRDCYMNYQWEFEIPCIICTNKLSLLARLLKDPDFEGRVFVVEVEDYLGPPGTRPVNLERSKHYLTEGTLKKVDERQKVFEVNRAQRQPIVNMNLMRTLPK